ncbi:MAG TPA: helicase-associated domain-containing protein [Elusimicrobiota bacterium]|nr:helicase-associated domain-containing protein [Elusimicrobiota bacterium]
MWALNDLLKSLPTDQLGTMRRGLRLSGDADLPRIAQRLNHSDRIREFFAQLDPAEKNVLRYVLSQGGEAAESEIIEQLPEAPPALRTLREKFLLFAEPVDPSGRMLCIAQEHRRFISLTPDEKATTAGLVLRQPRAYIDDLAGLFQWDDAARARPSAALKRQWLTGERLSEFLAQQSEPVRQLWTRFVESDGILEMRTLQRFGIEPAVPPLGTLRPEDPLAWLYGHGLAFPNELPRPASYRIPSDILSRVSATQAGKRLAPARHVPGQLRAWGLRVLSDIQFLAALQASGRLQFTQNDIPLRHQLRAFLKALGVPEENYGLFLNLALEAFLATVVNRTTQALNDNPAEAMSRLIAYWRDGDRWQESSDFRDLRRSPDGVGDRTLKARRLTVLKALEALPVRQWIAYKDFEEWVYVLGWKRLDSGNQRGDAYYHNDRWPKRTFVPDLSPRDTLASMVAECLVWLGLVDVGLGRARKGEAADWSITHVRLTEWGRQFLDKKSGRFEPLPPVPPESQIRILPNLEITASPRLNPHILATVFKIAVFRGIHTFAMTKESLREALDEGLTLGEILEFLTRHSLTGIPPIVQQFIEDIAQKHGHIKLGMAGAYLQVDDPLLLVELRAQRSLTDIFKKQVADNLALLRRSDLERVAKTLRKLGYSPVVEKSEVDERPSAKDRW